MTIPKTDFAAAILDRDRRALARAITLVESTRPKDREKAEALLTGLLPHTGGALRLGISGPPGAGKSTFIEALGAHVTAEGRRLAVLAVDPSSQRSGGSILGDKTRMDCLSRNSAAFIRPSPAGSTLGGVARRTRESILLVEAAGFDLVVVETVGVGQSETAVADMVDLFVLLVSPGGGDELQGIKRGVMELADVVLVTKADGELETAAAHAAADYARALHLFRPKYSGMSPEVRQISALKGGGIAESWETLCRLHQVLADSGQLEQLRQRQLLRWFDGEMQSVLMENLFANSPAAESMSAFSYKVRSGEMLPTAAARALLARLSGGCR